MNDNFTFQLLELILTDQLAPADHLVPADHLTLHLQIYPSLKWQYDIHTEKFTC